MLAELTVKEFLDKVAGSDPVPGGGSVAALNGAVASALTAMVAGLTIGKKGYEEHEELMKHISRLSIRQQELFVEYIDRDSEAYDHVFQIPPFTEVGDAFYYFIPVHTTS
jgi:methenyltetrahydrofolate cyclohydrolase